MLVFILLLGSKTIEYLSYSVIFLPASILLVYGLSFETGIVNRFLSSGLLIKLGARSPEFFLIHQVVIRAFEYFAGELLPDTLKIVLYLAITYCLCVAYAKLEATYDRRIVTTK